MNEYTTLYQISGCGLALVLASFLYSLGGRSGKWKRRFIASAVLSTAVNVACLLRGLWDPLMIVIYLPLMGGFSLGYGDKAFGFLTTSWIHKTIKRFIYASAILMSGVLMAYCLGGNAWWILIPHVGVGLWSIYLGVKNPVEAAAEEFLVCMVLNLFLISYPFVSL